MRPYNSAPEALPSQGKDAMGRTGMTAVALLVSCLLVPGPVHAEDDNTLELLAGTCASCHGTAGRSPGSIPSLAGLSYEVLVDKLAAFKADKVPNATIMPRIAAGYSDEDLAALARYFNSLTAGKDP